ncbi:E3 ubiquitin-protein ligase NRDP1 isoform X3 [Oncorhynchus tshawytscha]|nr:E3 ubiquitin-protein ligase NRDP1 isoform X3 [Oncorhynchus tshawytscha]XP_042180511.1 E3 ubiquitin-protein ligase NRDP1 isoform X3 [Oncorhynchus tshawytscha]
MSRRAVDSGPRKKRHWLGSIPLSWVKGRTQDPLRESHIPGRTDGCSWIWGCAMGYDVTRFQGEVDEDLLCPICSGVLEEPVQAPHCEHAFCNACITQWFSQQQICPVDRSVVTLAHLHPVPRIMRNMLSKLQITCDNAGFGCTAVLRLDQLQSHLRDCQHNPKRPFQCEQGCGQSCLTVNFIYMREHEHNPKSAARIGLGNSAVGDWCYDSSSGLEMPKDEVSSHNCIKHLRSVVQQQQGKVTDLDKTAAENKHQLAEQKRDIQLLKAYMRAIRSANPNLQNLEETIEYNEILEWVNSLQPARVTRWGGMISTPDAVLQAVIKRSLIDSGCPPSIVNDLIENAHERNWPAGLATLETRQMNRRYYENYVAKRIPGKQAVVVMACENQHMGEDMILEPGLVMIFAHGVEEIL